MEKNVRKKTTDNYGHWFIDIPWYHWIYVTLKHQMKSNVLNIFYSEAILDDNQVIEKTRVMRYFRINRMYYISTLKSSQFISDCTIWSIERMYSFLPQPITVPLFLFLSMYVIHEYRFKYLKINAWCGGGGNPHTSKFPKLTNCALNTISHTFQSGPSRHGVWYLYMGCSSYTILGTLCLRHSFR